MPMIYQVIVENDLENELTQKILFCGGHNWSSNKYNIVPFICNHSIGVWDDYELTYGRILPLRPVITFEQFINKMENDLLG